MVRIGVAGWTYQNTYIAGAVLVTYIFRVSRAAKGKAGGRGEAREGEDGGE